MRPACQCECRAGVSPALSSRPPRQGWGAEGSQVLLNPTDALGGQPQPDAVHTGLPETGSHHVQPHVHVAAFPPPMNKPRPVPAAGPTALVQPALGCPRRGPSAGLERSCRQALPHAPYRDGDPLPSREIQKLPPPGHWPGPRLPQHQQPRVPRNLGGASTHPAVPREVWLSCV